ncbi:VRR-NUC domain-containing protein [Celerinatantimonas sp. YJH-8]|uniref:VRR-NUC domain-containing protein n=1 Tax=Celerinatantimonas sp. YJH-8 TaxID=3228714 RepID=UPI0038C5E10C
MSDPVSTIELPSDYYLTNFWQLIDGVTQRYDDLLTPHEQQLIATLCSLSLDAQLLYVRLLCRKGIYFRFDKLRYSEIGDMDAACIELKQAQLVEINAPLSWDAIGHICTVSELRTFGPFAKTLAKPQLLAALAEQTPPAQLSFDVLTLLENDWLTLFSLLYFNNPHQNLTDFVLSDLKVRQYEQYRLDKQTRLYQDRAQIEQALQLALLADELEQQPKGGSWPIDPLLSQLPEPLEHPALQRRRRRILEKIAREYERREQHPTALDLYTQCDSAFSRERQIRILAKTAPEQALQYLEQWQTHPLSLSEQQFIAPFHYRLARQLKRPIDPPATVNYQRIDWSQPRMPQAPEQSALSVLREQGWQGVHCENALINGMLALTLWDILFMDQLPGVFFHPFQAGPADLYAHDFIHKRQPQADQALESVLTPSWPTLIRQRYRQKQGLINPLFDWQAFPESLLEAALTHVPAPIWRHLFDYQLSDLKLTRAGMPDLFVWNHNQYGWIEVKGPHDKLQKNQLIWLEQLQRLEQPVAVCFLGHNEQAQDSPLYFR